MTNETIKTSERRLIVYAHFNLILMQLEKFWKIFALAETRRKVLHNFHDWGWWWGGF